MDSLSNYKPQVSLSEHFGVDNKLPENERAFQIFENLKRARLYQDALFLVIGKNLKITRDEKLYKYWDFETFEAFLACEEFSFSREKAYMCIRVYEFYFEKLQLSEGKIQRIGISKLAQMLPILKVEDNDDIVLKMIDEAESMRYSDVVKGVKDKKNTTGKPSVYWSEELEKWKVHFYEDTTSLVSLGKYAERQED